MATRGNKTCKMQPWRMNWNKAGTEDRGAKSQSEGSTGAKGEPKVSPGGAKGIRSWSVSRLAKSLPRQRAGRPDLIGAKGFAKTLSMGRNSGLLQDCNKGGALASSAQIREHSSIVAVYVQDTNAHAQGREDLSSRECHIQLSVGTCFSIA